MINSFARVRKKLILYIEDRKGISVTFQIKNPEDNLAKNFESYVFDGGNWGKNHTNKVEKKENFGDVDSEVVSNEQEKSNKEDEEEVSDNETLNKGRSQKIEQEQRHRHCSSCYSFE